MNSLVIAAYAIAPTTAMMLLGFFCKKQSIVKEESMNEFNKVVYLYLLPLTMFENIVTADLSTPSNMLLIGYAFTFLACIALVSMVVLHFTGIGDAQKGVIIQALSRSSFATLGLSVAENIYGKGNVAVTSILVATAVPFMNIMAVMILQKYSGGKSNLIHLFCSVFKNPMVIGALAGFSVALLRIPIPELVMRIVNYISKMTTPLALFVLGGVFQWGSMKKNIRLISVTTILRLIVIPMIGLLIAVMLGFTGVALTSLLLLLGGAVAVGSFPMAQQMGLDGDLAGQIVLTTTLFVLPSLFFFIMGLGLLGLI